MLFNSFEFLAFFLMFLAVFFALPPRAQPIVLLIASYVFYMSWRPSFGLLLGLTTVVDYTTALMMARSRTEAGRKAAMIVALAINLGVLGTVKYLDFLIANVIGAAGLFGYVIPDYALGLILPLGISFYTFQSVGYTLDVYNRKVEAERDFLTYAQYVSFFPQLIAGPIERAAHMLPQFRIVHRLTYRNVTSGLFLVGYGLFKKMCIADVVAPVVNGIYASPAQYSGGYQLLAAVLFAIQIYCDFSGYSDIARGTARIMGFDLMINFRQPYFATSLNEFWRCWHISLSTWFRDYLFIPLGGSRGSERSTARNLMIVFSVSGIWHGAAWTFVAWGVLHGAGLVIERIFERLVRPEAWLGEMPRRLLGWLWMMSIVLIGWIFFRSTSVTNAIMTLRSLVDLGPVSYFTLKMLGLASVELVMLAVSLMILLIVDFHLAFRPQRLVALGSMRWVSTGAGVAIAYYIILFGIFGHAEFIYFQF
ncbi:MBOAT family protein [Bradyrhizobium diazoefficiens]|jgi:alginate O-acetyltransferase complex protein AlgI|nr:MBOAT family O-acyltransferase [Bradyrhizobium diazoefficiens]UCF51147.1 MAG: MBOAT family protein [Bradyrhizobium sp.]MBR0964130.1 MBOAT family protein [Bradyrhizobium diazoefficiens]MBR0978290.1 MBOAT family protein [Bradyrhizobium diazoefficiens]MBR1006221.1 MBOAT family protein [Bradyrhizobium diazoefficiens]MBR1014273.1 MBOAT family protein [Bradyrhizobium diazoefficiens]